jgi:hypothetical protein
VIDQSTEPNVILHYLVAYLEAQGSTTTEDQIAWVLRNAVLNVRTTAAGDVYEDPDGSACLDMTDPGNKWIFDITIHVPAQHMSVAGTDDCRGKLQTALEQLIDCGGKRFAVNLAIKAWLPPVRPDEGIGLNTCFFKTEHTIEHDRLRFRSRAEIALYEALKRRNVLFFPNPAAVLGTNGPHAGEKPTIREPDFLVCYKGKWGILEVHGDVFHRGQAKTAKDHERMREFNRYGLFFFQAYSDSECRNTPDKVVDGFLKLLEAHK